MLRRHTGPPTAPLGAAPTTSHTGAVTATVIVLTAWVCVTMSADTLAPWVGDRAAAVERALGLDVAQPPEDD